MLNTIVTLISKLQAGTVYSHATGATCPVCGYRAKCIRSLPPENNVRIRFHKCSNQQCFVCRCNLNIKSCGEA